APRAAPASPSPCRPAERPPPASHPARRCLTRPSQRFNLKQKPSRYSGMEELHATCVALPSPIGPLGVLLLGPSDSGKSDLALRLVDAGGWLVADDRVRLGSEEGLPVARPLPGFEGLLEVRGFGLARLARLDSAPVALAVQLEPAAGQERLPEPKVYSA